MSYLFAQEFFTYDSRRGYAWGELGWGGESICRLLADVPKLDQRRRPDVLDFNHPT